MQCKEREKKFLGQHKVISDIQMLSRFRPGAYPNLRVDNMRLKTLAGIPEKHNSCSGLGR